uniref:BEACH domain-containing protein n=1 Tax=Spongospora subterranea TaxID=70186 RepID=A0A0H5QNB8_9EUKA|eukprot:CRZ02861.1 hypothetical protein [Spongospora subterranea]
MLGRRPQPKRFNPTLLAENEDYISDYLCVFALGGQSGMSCSGRLKLCSQSLIIDPDQFEHPIYRYRFSDISSLELVDSASTNRSQYVMNCVSNLNPSSAMVLVVHARVVIEMKHFGQDSPYVFRQLSGASVVTALTLSYSDLTKEFSLIKQLWDISLLSDHSVQLERFMSDRIRFASFDSSCVTNIKERPLLDRALPCSVIAPLQQSLSMVMLTDIHLYVQPLVQDATQSKCSGSVASYPIRYFDSVLKRRHNLKHVAIEIFFADSQNHKESDLFLSFATTEQRDNIYRLIIEQSQLPPQPTLESVMNSWVSGSISNFDYIMALNRFAGRSYMDFTAYPVFPWIIADYHSKSLDVSDPKVFRDLSKPIGALNPKRLQQYRERYREMPDDNPRFLYGTHYSNPGYVVYYLVRAHPSYMLSLQSGRFDAADRLFCSIEDTWRSCNNNPADVKELIPQFYDTSAKPKFLMECSPFLGHRHDGSAVGAVSLPPWANNDPCNFVSMLREALDCEHVKRHLHHWIDLIFGFSQRGEAAEQANNVFYHMTYEGAVDINTITEDRDRRALLAQIREFGQTPSQLFTAPHPIYQGRGSCIATPSVEADPVCSPSSTNSVPTHLFDDALIIQDGIGRGTSRILEGSATWIQESSSLHSKNITGLMFDVDDPDSIVSVSLDGSLKIYSVPDRRLRRSCTLGEAAIPLSCICPASNSLVACGSWDDKLHIYSTSAGRVIETLDCAHDDAVTDCQYSFSRQQLASCSRDATIKVWDFGSSGVKPVPIHFYMEQNAAITCIDWGQFGTMLATGAADSSVFIWDTRCNESVYSIREVHSGELTDLCWISDMAILTCSSDGSLLSTDIRTGKAMKRANLDAPLSCLRVVDNVVAVASQAGQIFLYNSATLTLIHRQMLCAQGEVFAMDLSDDGAKICAGTDIVTIWIQNNDT